MMFIKSLYTYITESSDSTDMAIISDYVTKSIDKNYTETDTIKVYLSDNSAYTKSVNDWRGDHWRDVSYTCTYGPICVKVNGTEVCLCEHGSNGYIMVNNLKYDNATVKKYQKMVQEVLRDTDLKPINASSSKYFSISGNGYSEDIWCITKLSSYLKERWYNTIR